MMLKLFSTDEQCAQRVKRVWKEMINTTLRCKDDSFNTLEDYVNFRIIDTGAPYVPLLLCHDSNLLTTYARFVEAMMLWGMGMTLTPEEDKLLAPIVYPCFAALGLANDYFSFDRELKEMQENRSDNFINAVWLHMRWHGVDASAAKDMVRQATIAYEQEFLQRCEGFRKANAPVSEKLDRYLRALSYQISGNVVWSLNCPRYHPEYRYGYETDIAKVSAKIDIPDRVFEPVQV